MLGARISSALYCVTTKEEAENLIKYIGDLGIPYILMVGERDMLRNTAMLIVRDEHSAIARFISIPGI